MAWRLTFGRLSPVATAGTVLAAALAAWVVAIARMRGMDEGPGSDLGSLGWYLGTWVTMMAAMMLPSALPRTLLVARVGREQARRREAAVPVWLFVAGYLATWAAIGLAAYALYRGIAAFELGFLAWDEHGPLVAGAAVGAAGAYQLTPLKRLCLRHCRSPLAFILLGWRHGRTGALRMGAEHGAYCAGCCVGLMLILFVLGAMSLLWMALVSAVVFAEKVLPFGARLTVPVAVCLIALGLWIVVAPGSVPGLVEPGGSMQMEMR